MPCMSEPTRFSVAGAQEQGGPSKACHQPVRPAQSSCSSVAEYSWFVRGHGDGWLGGRGAYRAACETLLVTSSKWRRCASCSRQARGSTGAGVDPARNTCASRALPLSGPFRRHRALHGTARSLGPSLALSASFRRPCGLVCVPARLVPPRCSHRTPDTAWQEGLFTGPHSPPPCPARARPPSRLLSSSGPPRPECPTT